MCSRNDMSSWSSKYSQSLTNQFNVTLSQNLYLPSDFEAWYEGNQEFIQKIGNHYIVSKDVPFANILNGSPILAPTGSITMYKSVVKDFGKQIFVGTQNAPNLFVFRLIQIPGRALQNGTPDRYNTNQTGYCVLENNTSEVFERPVSITYV